MTAPSSINIQNCKQNRFFFRRNWNRAAENKRQRNIPEVEMIGLRINQRITNRCQRLGCVLAIQKTAKNKKNREWKKEIQTFFAHKQQWSRVKTSSAPLLLNFCFVNSNWFHLSLIRFSSVPNSASFFFSVLAFQKAKITSFNSC
jgi:hypothetical protein